MCFFYQTECLMQARHDVISFLRKQFLKNMHELLALFTFQARLMSGLKIRVDSQQHTKSSQKI